MSALDKQRMNLQRPLAAIASADISRDPTPFFYCERFLDSRDFDRLRAAMPPVPTMTRYEPPHQFRYYYMLDRLGVGAMEPALGETWHEAAAVFLSREMIGALHDKFADLIRMQTPHRARLIEKVTESEGVVETPRLMITSDCQDFLLKPHTDSSPKVVTLLYYLAEVGDPEDWGTEFYAPIDETFRSFPSEHFDPEGFTRRARAPFRPNCAVGFVKTDASFHGVDARGLDGRRRDMVVLNLELGRRNDFDLSVHVDLRYFGTAGV